MNCKFCGEPIYIEEIYVKELGRNVRIPHHVASDLVSCEYMIIEAEAALERRKEKFPEEKNNGQDI